MAARERELLPLLLQRLEHVGGGGGDDEDDDDNDDDDDNYKVLGGSEATIENRGETDKCPDSVRSSWSVPARQGAILLQKILDFLNFSFHQRI